MTNTADSVEFAVPVYLLYFNLFPIKFTVRLSLRCTCRCGSTCNPVAVLAWPRSLGVTSLILITQDVTFPSTELGQCTDRVPTWSKSSEPPASGSQQVHGGHEGSEEKFVRREGRVSQRLLRLLLLPLECRPASCHLLSGRVWSKTVCWSIQGGISLVLWHKTQQHMRAAQLRDALPPGSPSLTPQTTPSHPFLEAWAHTTFSRIRGITLGVYVRVRARLLQLRV